MMRKMRTPAAPAMARKRQDHSLAMRTPGGTVETAGALLCSAERNARNMRSVYEPARPPSRVAGPR